MAYDYTEELKKLTAVLSSREELEREAENDLQALRVQNIQLTIELKKQAINSNKTLQIKAENDLLQNQLAIERKIEQAKADRINKTKKKEMEAQGEVRTKLAAMGLATNKKEQAALRKQFRAEAKEKVDAQIKAENEKRKKQHKALLSADEKKALQKQAKAKADAEAEASLKNGQKVAKQLAKAQEQADRRKEREDLKKGMKEGVLGAGKSFSERAAAWKELTSNGKGGTDFGKAFGAIAGALADFSKQLDNQVNEIAGKMGSVDTRLQGSKNKTKGYLGGRSYWESMLQDVTAVAGISPFIKQSALTGNIEQFVNKGISFDVEQRAFLQTISDKIATTFDATDSALLRLVKIQQQDTTASRLGMESALTAFLNNMYETTEYMSSLAASVRQNLVEAQSLMSGAAGVELEYQVQKWLGSLSSVGMSDAAISSLSQTIGDLAAGKVGSITNGGTGNLAVMAANKAGLSVADILAGGLDANKTNQLMTAMIDYMAGMYSESRDSKVVQQQLANVFGLSASDLKAAMNLSSSTSKVAGNNLTNKGMLAQLQSMYNTMYQRTSMGEMVTNVKDNFIYTMASGIASNPALYFLNTAAGLLDSVAGGIALPDIKVMGSGVNLQTTVADLMRVGALGGSMLSGIGAMIGGLAKGGGNGLKTMGIDMSGNGNWVTRGTGENLRTETSGFSTTESGSFAGNSDSGDIQASTLNGAKDDANSQYVEAQESEDADVKNKVIDEHVVQIYQLLDSVINGTSYIKVGNVLSGGTGTWNP